MAFGAVVVTVLVEVPAFVDVDLAVEAFFVLVVRLRVLVVADEPRRAGAAVAPPTGGISKRICSMAGVSTSATSSAGALSSTVVGVVAGAVGATPTFADDPAAWSARMPTSAKLTEVLSPAVTTLVNVP